MTDNIHWLSGMRYVCNVPSDLGAVTKLELRGGKIVAETESGISMIVPNPDHFSTDEYNEPPCA